MIQIDYFIKKEISRLAANAAKRAHCYRSINDIKTVLFICDSIDWNEARGCIDSLKSMGKTVHTAVFSPSSKDVPTWISNYLLLRGDKDVNIWGYPDKSIKQQFIALHADMIINLSNENNLAMHYLYLQHPSTCKVGIKHSDMSAHDVAIVPDVDNG
ncbi:MAG: hypothetical protein LBD53_02925, partial [Tannerella sp.]|nr:hypothetical protein [Tannerella sp.]